MRVSPGLVVALALWASLGACGARTELEAASVAAADGGLDAGVEEASGHDASAPPGDGDSGPTPLTRCLQVSGDIDGPTSPTWLWNGAWSELAPARSPAARSGAVARALGGRVVLFGGYGVLSPVTTTYLHDTWVYDGDPGTWTEIRAAVAPPARDAAAAATLGDAMIVFGGQDPSGSLGDTWRWDGSAWSEVHPAASPSPRWGAAAATLGDRAVLFGGVIGDRSMATDSNDTWVFDGATWTEVTPALSPPPRDSAVMATVGAQVILFGGQGLVAPGSTHGYLSDTWGWDGVAWTEIVVESGPAPSARRPGCGASLGGQLVVAGGYTNAGTVADTWLLDGASWTRYAGATPAVIDLLGSVMTCL